MTTLLNLQHVPQDIPPAKDPHDAESEARALADQRRQRLDMLEDMFQKDRRGFDLFWLDLFDDDPTLRTMLSHGARAHGDVLIYNRKRQRES